MTRTLVGKLLLAGGGLLLGVAIAAAFIIANVLLIRTAANHLTNHTLPGPAPADSADRAAAPAAHGGHQ